MVSNLTFEKELFPKELLNLLLILFSKSINSSIDNISLLWSFNFSLYFLIHPYRIHIPSEDG